MLKMEGASGTLEIFFLTQQAMKIIINPYNSNPETGNDGILTC